MTPFSSPVVSVFCITYNHEGLIAQALDSALSQKTNFPFEIVVGEDCSTDGTRAIVQDYQKRYPHIIRPLLPECNLGMYQNVIHTLNACRGKYVAALEGDDYWTSDTKLQKQVDFLEANPDCAICFHKAMIVDESGARPTIVVPEKVKPITTLEDILYQNFIPTCSSMWRNGLFKELPAWIEEVKFADWIIHVFNAEHGKIGFIDECMAVYRIHSGGTWSTQSWETVMNRWIRAYEEMGRRFGGRYDAIIKRAIFYRLYGFTIDCIDRRVPEAGPYLWRLVRSGPLFSRVPEKGILVIKYYAPSLIRIAGRVRRSLRRIAGNRVS